MNEINMHAFILQIILNRSFLFPVALLYLPPHMIYEIYKYILFSLCGYSQVIYEQDK